MELREAIVGVQSERGHHEAQALSARHMISEEIDADQFLQLVQDQTQRVFGEDHHLASPAAGSFGVVQGAILRATNLPADSHGNCDSYIKVSAVEVGKGPIMFRCKTPIHTTDTAINAINPTYSNNHFSFQTNDELTGDLLFSAYERSAGHSRVVGQFIIPLQKLVDPGGHGGKQRTLRLNPHLQTQQGDTINSKIHLTLELTLPPGGASQRERVLGSTKVQELQQKISAQKGKTSLSRKSVGSVSEKSSRAKDDDSLSGNRRRESDRIARENERNKKRLKEVQCTLQKQASKKRETAKSAHKKKPSSSFINRQRFLQQVARDNITHQHRIKRFDGPQKTTSEEKHKRMSAIETKRKERSDKEMQRRYRETSDLVREVSSLQAQLAELRKDTTLQNQRLERVKSTIQKDQRVIKNLDKMTAAQKKATKVPGAQSSSSAENRESMIDAQRREVALADRKHGAKVKELEQLHSKANLARKRVLAKYLEVQQQCDQAQSETQEIEERIAWAKARRLWWKHLRNQTLPEGMTQDEKAEHEALDKIQSEMTFVKVDIEAMSLTVAQKGSSDSRYSRQAADLDDALDRLESKIADKEKKLDALQATRAVWKHRQEDVIRADEAAVLRSDIRELQHLLRMCDRERQRETKLKAESAAAVDAERRKFEHTQG